MRQLFLLFSLSFDLFRYDLSQKNLKGLKLNVKAFIKAYSWIVTKNSMCFNNSPYEMWKKNKSDELILFLKAKMGYE